jgi:SAM-dependent methyltransferase
MSFCVTVIVDNVELDAYIDVTMNLTSDRPRLLDLCCGVGGASVGYERAGWDVTGVDLKPQPNYGGSTFVQADAIEYLLLHIHEFDAVHASFPCQGYSIATPTWAKVQKAEDWYRTDLIPVARDICDEYSKPLVMENVMRAERDYRHPGLVVNTYGVDLGPEFDGTSEQMLIPVQRPITLCGEMFGLDVIRHRVFEVGEMVSQPEHKPHRGGVKDGTYVTVAGHGGDGGKGQCSLASWQYAMAMPWAKTRHELAEAIPPAYTMFLGRQMLAWGW